MLIEDLITLGKMLYKEKAFFGKRLHFGTSKGTSIAARANVSTYFFPVIAEDNLTSDEIVMIMRALERTYAVFTRTSFMLIPATEVDSFDEAMITDYLSKFHNNMGIRHDFDFDVTLNSAITKDLNANILNEATKVELKSPYGKVYGDDVSIGNTLSFGSVGSTVANASNDTLKYGKGEFNNLDWKKANDLLPSSVTVPARFISKDTNQAHTVEIMVNVKAEMHKTPAEVLANGVASTMAEKKTLLNFVKLVSGEEASISDFLFGISQMKSDLITKGNPWLESFKRRKRLADLSFGMLKNNFIPTGTIALTMNTVNVLKQKYDIDVFKSADKIMKEYFLLGLLIADQTNEVLYTRFDSHSDFQEYPYKTLERESASQDKVIQNMIKAMGSYR